MQTKLITGIDISKQYFDAAITLSGNVKEYFHQKFLNNEAGFKQFAKKIPPETICVMEASGPYYLKLATYLHTKELKVCVVNPLSVKHFSRMRLMRTKTDKKDSALIAEYAYSEEPPLWVPKEQYELELQQLQALLENCTRQKTVLTNQLESFNKCTVQNKLVVKSIAIQLKLIKTQMTEINKIMEVIIVKHFEDLHTRLQSIPGLGKRSSIELIMITNGFKRFENVKQLTAYVGLCPRIFDSGTSIKGKARICKMGMSRMRKLLFLCAMRAIRCNKACIELYSRLKLKGKSGKLALVAVANKLLRQAFAIGIGNMYFKEI